MFPALFGFRKSFWYVTVASPICSVFSTLSFDGSGASSSARFASSAGFAGGSIAAGSVLASSCGTVGCDSPGELCCGWLLSASATALIDLRNASPCSAGDGEADGAGDDRETFFGPDLASRLEIPGRPRTSSTSPRLLIRLAP